MELGGNAPFVVFDDADVAAAVEGAMAAKYRNTGQTCVCANRFFVHEAVADEFVAALAARVEALRCGHGMEEGVAQGPLINGAGFDKVRALVDDAVARGATVVTGGAPRPELGPHFYAPTVLAGVTDDMDVSSAEIFGPVAAVRTFASEEEAVALANDTSSGLAAYVYTRDVGRCLRVAGELQFGMVGVNEAAISTEVAPFGGIKDSGVGREGGPWGMEEYQEVKYICLGL